MTRVPGARWVEQVRRRWDRVLRGTPAPVRRFGGWLRSDDVVSTSSSLAFYALVSIPPMVLFAFWVASGFISDAWLEQLGSQIDESSPDELSVGGVVLALIDVATTIGVFSALAALWPASAYGAALGRAFETVTPTVQRRLPTMRARLLTLVVVALLPLVVVGGVGLLYLGPRLLPWGGWRTTAVGAVGALAVVLVLVGVLFLLFRMHDTAPADVAVGAALTTTLMAVVTGGYLLYLRLFADFESRYGTSELATLVLLALWLLLVNASLIVGYRVMLGRALRRASERESASAA